MIRSEREFSYTGSANQTPTALPLGHEIYT